MKRARGDNLAFGIGEGARLGIIDLRRVERVAVVVLSARDQYGPIGERGCGASITGLMHRARGRSEAVGGRIVNLGLREHVASVVLSAGLQRRAVVQRGEADTVHRGWQFIRDRSEGVGLGVIHLAGSQRYVRQRSEPCHRQHIARFERDRRSPSSCCHQAGNLNRRVRRRRWRSATRAAAAACTEECERDCSPDASFHFPPGENLQLSRRNRPPS